MSLIWLPMYKRLTTQIGADSSVMAMSFGFGSFVAFLVLRQLQRLPHLTLFAIAAEALLVVSVLVAKKEIIREASDLQLMIVAFFAIGIAQAFVFSILQAMMFRNVSRQHAFRLRSIGTLGFGFGVGMYLTNLTHDSAIELAIYLLALVAVMLLAALKGNELPPVNSDAGTTTLHPVIVMILLLSFMASFLEGVNGQTAQKWLTESMNETNALMLILTGLLLEGILLLFVAPYVSDALLVLVGFFGWFLVFQGFAMSNYSLSVCSFCNCALGFTLASYLARCHRPSFQALLCVMNAVGTQVACVSILSCRLFLGEEYIAFVAIVAASVALVLSASTVYRIREWAKDLDRPNVQTTVNQHPQ